MSLSSLLKKEITNLLHEGRYLEILKLHHNPNRIINRLISLSYNKQIITAWRAMEAIGIISREIASYDPEFVRTLVGKLLWMIRDESGGIGWSAYIYIDGHLKGFSLQGLRERAIMRLSSLPG